MPSSYSSSIDDDDSARVWYRGSWRSSTDQGGATYHETQTINARVNVEFTGTRIAIIANVLPGPPRSVNFVEGRVYIHEWKYVSYELPSTETGTEIVFWESGDLPPGTHTLTFDYGDDRSRASVRRFQLDRFDYEPLAPPPNPGPPPPGKASNSDPGQALGGGPPGPGSTATPSDWTEPPAKPETSSIEPNVATPTQPTRNATTTRHPLSKDGLDISTPTGASTEIPTRTASVSQHTATPSNTKQKISLITTCTILIPLAFLLAWLYRRRLKKPAQHSDAMSESRAHLRASVASTWSSFYNDPASRVPTPHPNSNSDVNFGPCDVLPPLPPLSSLPFIGIESPSPSLGSRRFRSVRTTYHGYEDGWDMLSPTERREGVVFDPVFHIAALPPVSALRCNFEDWNRSSSVVINEIGDDGEQDFMDAPESAYYLSAGFEGMI